MAAAAYDAEMTPTWTRSARRQYLALVEEFEAVAESEVESLAEIRERIDQGKVRIAAFSLGDLAAVSWR